jgi:hypothetical protein
MLDKRPGGAATAVRRRRSALAPHAPVPRPLATAYGSALALGCACRPDSCTRASARGGRRVVPVAGHDAAAAGVSRRDGSPTCTHVLHKPRVEARITLTTCAPSPNARPSTERRRDARSAPGLDGAARRGNALPTSHLHRRSRLDGQTLLRSTHGDSVLQGRARPPAWGSRGASPLLCPSSSPARVRVALRTATAALRDTSGPRTPSVAARQCCGAKAGIQAVGSQRRASTQVPTQQESKGGEEKWKAVVLTAGRRCRRGRPDEDGSLRFRREGVPAM